MRAPLPTPAAAPPRLGPACLRSVGRIGAGEAAGEWMCQMCGSQDSACPAAISLVSIRVCRCVVSRGPCLFKALGIFLLQVIEFEQGEGRIPQF